MAGGQHIVISCDWLSNHALCSRSFVTALHHGETQRFSHEIRYLDHSLQTEATCKDRRHPRMYMYDRSRLFLPVSFTCRFACPYSHDSPPRISRREVDVVRQLKGRYVWPFISRRQSRRPTWNRPREKALISWIWALVVDLTEASLGDWLWTRQVGFSPVLFASSSPFNCVIT